jgi:hypothetical protein
LIVRVALGPKFAAFFPVSVITDCQLVMTCLL